MEAERERTNEEREYWALLEGAGIEVRDQRPALLGVATILTGRTLEVTDRVREANVA